MARIMAATGGTRGRTQRMMDYGGWTALRKESAWPGHHLEIASLESRRNLCWISNSKQEIWRHQCHENINSLLREAKLGQIRHPASTFPGEAGCGAVGHGEAMPTMFSKSKETSAGTDSRKQQTSTNMRKLNFRQQMGKYFMASGVKNEYQIYMLRSLTFYAKKTKTTVRKVKIKLTKPFGEQNILMAA